MLEEHYRRQVAHLLNQLECNIDLPQQWRDDYFNGEGTVLTSLNEHRRFVRHICRSKMILKLETSLPAFPRTREFFMIYSKDISRNGVGFLHVEQLFPGENAHLWLPTHITPITVVSCRKFTPKCFLIGATFTREPDSEVTSLN